MKRHTFARALPAATLCALVLSPAAANEVSVLSPEPLAMENADDGQATGELKYADAISKQGRVEVVRERFPDGSVFIERETTLDENENFVNHGFWRMYDRAGNVTAEGRYEMGERVGPWQRWHDASTSPEVKAFPFNRFRAPFLSQATFKNGVMDGPWIIMDAENRKVMQIAIEDGKRHGVTITWAPSGQVIRQISYDHGVPVGDVLELTNGAQEVQRVATYLNGREVVEKKANHPRSRNKKFIETYLAPKTVLQTPDDFWSLTFAKYAQEGEEMLHGMSQHWHPSGQLERQGEYHMGAKTGRFTFWHSNGQKRAEGEYVDDKQNGVWVWWHENGQKAVIGHYDHGDLTGRWRWWGDDGKLADQKTYGDAGEPVARRLEPRFEF